MLYDELKDQNFVIIAVALDAGGCAAVEKSIRPTVAELAERPPVLASLMGWSEELWSRKAPPEYPCLIDEEHIVADLFVMANVTMGVWIDEQGRIVRPTESPGHSDYFRRMDNDTFELPEADAKVMIANRNAYFTGLRDWVAKGAESDYVLSPEEARRRIRRPNESDVRAALHARIGGHLSAQGDLEAAKHHYEEAVRLSPEKWNYFRQSMVLEPELVGELNTAPEFFARQAALGDKLYVPTTEMPGIAGPPPWLKELESGSSDA